VKIEVVFNSETFSLTQKAVAELFGVKVPAISKHLTNIFETNELAENSVISILETTAADGKNYKTYYYKLDAIPLLEKSSCKSWLTSEQQIIFKTEFLKS